MNVCKFKLIQWWKPKLNNGIPCHLDHIKMHFHNNKCCCYLSFLHSFQNDLLPTDLAKTCTLFCYLDIRCLYEKQSPLSIEGLLCFLGLRIPTMVITWEILKSIAFAIRSPWIRMLLCLCFMHPSPLSVRTPELWLD